MHTRRRPLLRGVDAVEDVRVDWEGASAMTPNLSPTRKRGPSRACCILARQPPPHLYIIAFSSHLPPVTMAPRKKAKASAASTPLAETQPKTPQDTGAATHSQHQLLSQNESMLNDAWSDDQETQLYKGMIKWKPTGA